MNLNKNSGIGLLMLCLLVLSVNVNAAENVSPWKKVDENSNSDSGWTLFSRKLRGSEFHEFRISGLVDVPPAAAIRAARKSYIDARYTPENERRTLLRGSENQLVMHIFIELPAPLTDRELTAQYDFYHNTEASVYGVKWHQIKNMNSQSSGEALELVSSHGGWEFRPAPGGKSFATAIGHGDLGGSIPAWLINSMSGSAFVDGLERVREIARKLSLEDTKDRLSIR